MRPYSLLTLPLVFVAACGSSSGGAIANSEIPLEDLPLPVLQFAATGADELIAAIGDDADLTRGFDRLPLSLVPATGTANYRGAAEFSERDNTGIFIRSAGEILIQVSFDTRTFEGEFGNFFDFEDSAPREGHILIENGVFETDDIRAIQGTSVEADVTGTFEFVDGVQEVEGVLLATFVGEDAQFFEGSAGGVRITPDGERIGITPFTVRAIME